MPDNYVRTPCVFKHRGGNLTRVSGKVILDVTILPRNPDVRALEPVGQGFERRENGCNDNLAMIGIRHQRLELERRIHGLTQELVHFPISGNNWFSHMSMRVV